MNQVLNVGSVAVRGDAPLHTVPVGAAATINNTASAGVGGLGTASKCLGICLFVLLQDSEIVFWDDSFLFWDHLFV